MANVKQTRALSGADAVALPVKVGRWLLVILLGVVMAMIVVYAVDRVLPYWFSLRSQIRAPQAFVAVNVLVWLIWMLSKNQDPAAGREVPAVRQGSLNNFYHRTTEPLLVREHSPVTSQAMPQNPQVVSASTEVAPPVSAVSMSSETSCITAGSDDESSSATLVTSEIDNKVEAAAKEEAAKETKAAAAAAAAAEEEESMEAIWKAIMRKSSSSRDKPRMKPRIRVVREPSKLFDDELYERAEDYIKKHYESLRLQRYESELRRRVVPDSI